MPTSNYSFNSLLSRALSEVSYNDNINNVETLTINGAYLKGGTIILIEKRLWTKNYIGICLSCFFQFMTHYALLTALPIFVVDILKSGNQEVGLTVTLFQAGAVSCRPFAGRWIDRLEKRKFLLLSLGIFLLASGSYLGVNNILILLVLRFFHGVGFGMGTTATSTIAAIIAPESRKGEGIGYLSMFTSLAMVIGPVLSLLIVIHFNFTVLYGFCGILALLSFISGIMTKIPEAQPYTQRDIKNSSGWRIYIEPRALPAAITGFFLAFVYGGILAFIPTYAKSLGIMEFASGFFALFAAAIIVPRSAIGKLFDRKGANSVIYPAIVIFVVGMLGLSRIQSPTGLLAAGIIIGLGFGALNPSLQAMAVKGCSDRRKGLAMATYLLFADIGIGLGSYVLGVTVLYMSYPAMYSLSSVVMIGNIFVYYLLCHKNRLKILENDPA